MRVLVVGCGYLGNLTAEAMASDGHAVEQLSARALIDGAGAPAAEPDLVVFAQGMSVGGRGFGRRYEAILKSRTGPLERIRTALPDGQEPAAILISSTVAGLTHGGSRALPAMQRAYEACFRALFPTGCVLRVAAMLGPGSQLEAGFAALARTRFLKHLRMAGRTDIPWADAELYLAAVRSAAAEAADLVVAYDRGFDLNGLLDQGCPVGRRLVLPPAILREIYALLGIPRAFVLVSIEAMRVSGWAFARKI